MPGCQHTPPHLGRGRSTAATRAPQRSRACSGPISASAPSTATVCPSSRSHSGCAITVRTRSAAEGSSTPAPAHESRRRASASPDNRSPRNGRLNSVSGSPVPRISTVDSEALPVSYRIASRGPSRPSGCRYCIRRCTACRPSPAIVTAACREAKPASRTRRKCTRYPRRQSASRSAPTAPTASTPRRASATTARPRTELLRRPPAPTGTTTPQSSLLIIASPRGFAWTSRDTHLHPSSPA